jgi:hypothetical protein
MNPIDRLDPSMAMLRHEAGTCGAECVFCRAGEGHTPEGLRITERIIDVPGEGRHRLVQEVSRTGDVLFEEEWASVAETDGVWSLVRNGFQFLARKLAELEVRWNEVRGGQPVDLVKCAQVKRDRKAARRRLRRLAAERSTVVVELDDAEERKLVRKVLAEDPSIAEPDDEIEVGDAVVWINGWLDATEVARLTLERPVIVVGSVARGLWEVLHEAADAFRLSLYRLTVAGCRAVIDVAVGTAIDHLNVSHRLAGGDNTLQRQIDCLSELAAATRNDLHWIRKRGNDVLHKAEQSVSEELALEALIRTQRALEQMTDVGVFGEAKEDEGAGLA